MHFQYDSLIKHSKSVLLFKAALLVNINKNKTFLMHFQGSHHEFLAGDHTLPHADF